MISTRMCISSKFTAAFIRIFFVSIFSFVLTAFALSAEVSVDDVSNAEYTEGFLTWLKVHSDSATGLPFSHVGDARFQGWTITYDAAVVALAYIADGKYTEAQKILDYYIATPEVWRLGGVIEAYIAGTSFTGTDWSVRSGANIWLGIAGIHLYRNVKDRKYLSLAETMAAVALSLQNTDINDPNFGGVALGPKGDPAYPQDQVIGYDIEKPAFDQIYATEVTIDAYALLRTLYFATGNEKYQRAAADCLHWLKVQGWHSAEQRFNRGYQDATVATDVQSWGVSAMGVAGLNAIAPGAAENLVAFVEEHCFVETSLMGAGKRLVSIRGVDFTDKKRVVDLGRSSLVSFEWTFQWINAYSRLAQDYEQLGEYEMAAKYQQKKQALLAPLLAVAVEDSGGLAFPYATLADVPIGHEYNTPAAGNLSAVGSAWAILAIKGLDPLWERDKYDGK